MALTRTQIINLINDYIYPNGNQRITGGQLNEILLAIANSYAMEGGDAGAGLEAVLAKGSNVSNGRVITNNNGGKLELAGEQLLGKDLLKYIGLHSLLGIYEGIVYSNPTVTGIGNSRNIPIFQGEMVKNGFRAITKYDVREEPEPKGKLSSRGIISTVEAGAGSAKLIHLVDSVNAAVYVAPDEDNPVSFISVSQGSVSGQVREWGREGNYQGQIDISPNQASLGVAQGPQSSSHVMQGNRISDRVTNGDAFFDSSLSEGRVIWNTQSGNITEVNTSGLMLYAGKKISIQASGLGQTAGIVTLVAGTVIVNTNAVGAKSVINLTVQESGTNEGNIRVSGKMDGVSFVISSSVNTDNCTVFWQIIDLL